MSEYPESTDNVTSVDANHRNDLNLNNDIKPMSRIEQPALSPNAKIPKMVRRFKDADDRRLPWCLLPTNIDPRHKLKSFISYMCFLKVDRYKQALNLLCMKECPIAKPVVSGGNILDADIIFVSDDSKQRNKNYKISNRLMKDRFVIADTTISRRVLRRRRQNDDDPERDEKLKIVCVENK